MTFINKLGNSFFKTGEVLASGSRLGGIATGAIMVAGLGGGSPETFIGAAYVSTALGTASLGVGGLGFGFKVLGTKLTQKVDDTAIPVITKK